ncbi:MAG: serine hydrolase domain-containing protein [bacterium]
MTIQRIALYVAAVVVLATPTHGQSALRARLDSAIPPIMRTGDVPGLEAAVILNGKLVWTGAFGVRSAASTERVDPHTVFRAASLTKPLFAYLVLRLADRGIIDLDAPIVERLQYVAPTTDPRTRLITPRMILSHTSGMPNCCGPWALFADPGTTWEYSPIGFDWLGPMVERVTGMSLNDVAKREVFEPLGMTRSSLVWNDTLESNAAASHTMWGRAQQPTRPPDAELHTAYASGSLQTTADDYANFLIAAMEGRGLSARSAPLLFTPQVELATARSQRAKPTALTSRLAWALGFGVARTDSSTEFWQWGDAGNAKAFVIGDARRHSAIVYFANAQTGLTIAGNIVSLVFPGEQYPVEMLGYPSIDDLPRLARRAIVLAALDSGAAAGARRLERERAQHPERVTVFQLVAAAEALRDERKFDAADTVLSLAAHYWPDSADVPIAQGDLRLALSTNSAAAAAFYRRALRIAPTNTVAPARLRWALGDSTGRANPIALPPSDLQRRVGTYGRIHITVANGHLMQARGEDAPDAMVAIAPDTFVLEKDASMIVRFTTRDSLTVEGYAGDRLTGERTPITAAP